MKSTMWTVVCVTVCLGALALPLSDSAKILGIFPTLSKSHWILGSSIMKELAASGHEVTVISPFPLGKPPKFYRDVRIVYNEQNVINDVIDSIFESTEDSTLSKIMEMRTFQDVMVNATFNSPEVQALLQSDESFDLLVLEIFLNDAMLGFADRFNCPVVGMTSFGVTSWANSLTGSPQPLSYVPHPLLDFTDRMTFWQRLGNVMFSWVDDMVLNFMLMPIQQKFYNAAFPHANRSLVELRRNGVSLILVNSHFSLSFPRPYLPNVIEVGGFHVNRKVNPLPENIKTFIEQSPNGVIYFSLGSNIKPSKMDPQKRDGLIRALSKVKENVIWKWDDDSLVLDKNKFMLGKWFPQDDILAHPNVKLFITHGGLLSCTESMYHGVPVVGVPIFGDQLMNMARAELAGWGVAVTYKELDESTFGRALTEVLNNEKYTRNVQTISRRLRDQPLAPMDTVKFWIEYVLRHNGADHLKSAAKDLNVFAYHNLDVYAFLMAVIVVLLVVVRGMLKYAVRRLNPFGGGRRQKTE